MSLVEFVEYCGIHGWTVYDGKCSSCEEWKLEKEQNLFDSFCHWLTNRPRDKT